MTLSPIKHIITCLFISVACLNSYAIDNNHKEYQIEVFATGLNSPWSMAFLPNDQIVITELGGQLRLIDHGQLLDSPITGTPNVYRAGQGGLMDVIADRDFKNNQRLYLSYAHGDKSGNATRLLSARLVDGALIDQKVLFTASPMKTTAHHYGGRIAQMKDETLLLTVGDGFNYREQAQLRNNHFGKIIRISTDGSIPKDNPWVNDDQSKPEIWSTGHRNQQAILVSQDDTVYEHEHGPRGGDEINIIKPGNNYGWPVITYGIDYNGAEITPYRTYDGMQQPIVNWTPSIAPSGMTLYESDLFPDWQGDLFAVSLKERSVRRIKITDGRMVSDERVFPELNQRLRDIKTGIDGALYILTDGKNGQLLRISPK